MLRWFPENISTYGGDIDAVFSLIYYIVGVWFLLAEGALFFFVFRYRRRAGRAAAYVRGERFSELAWVLVPAVIVLALDFGIEAAGGPVWARVKEDVPEHALRVNVRAQQFNWNFIYPGPDGQFDSADDVTLENELHVPAGRDVEVRLESKDVIHSFFIPNVRLKQDILPGRTIRAWFNATKPGRYELPCAELCGFGHYNMRGFLTVHSADEYERWLQEQWPAAAATAALPAS
ncbi:MAG: cytochrome c oxidase subunit II [Deltaproteobacteria bacterium]|nr:cytochrome c oxidase subunit II [Deltaproteobacteria bacterium]